MFRHSLGVNQKGQAVGVIDGNIDAHSVAARMYHYGRGRWSGCRLYTRGIISEAKLEVVLNTGNSILGKVLEIRF